MGQTPKVFLPHINCIINTDIISCTFKIELVELHLRDLQGRAND